MRATISLPVPLSPVMSTETFDGAICSISAKISRIAFELPTIEPRMPVFAQAAARNFKLNLGRALARGIGKDRPQTGGIDRLLQKVVGAQLHGVDGELDRPLRSEQHDGDIGLARFRRAWSAGPMPSIRGIFKSVTTMAGSQARVFSQPSMPSRAVSVLISPAGDQLGQSHQGVGFVFDDQDFYRIMHIIFRLQIFCHRSSKL